MLFALFCYFISPDLINRVFNGSFEPMDGLPLFIPEKWVPITGAPINPTARARPEEFIETGFSTLDGLNTLVKGQKPKWLRAKMPVGRGFSSVHGIVKEHRLSTVCEESMCPNIGECWNAGTATIMVMGSVCTRACRFCAVDTGNPNPLPLNFKMGFGLDPYRDDTHRFTIAAEMNKVLVRQRGGVGTEELDSDPAWKALFTAWTDEPLGEGSAAFYSTAGLRQARRHLAPGGILGVWSCAESAAFAAALREVFARVEVEPVTFENRVLEEIETNWIFLARDA